MKGSSLRKKKIVNDPVHGFIHIPTGIVSDLVEHVYFQRLRRIKQLGMTCLVYPGALHTRFQHALGATHLMSLAIDTLRSKGHVITKQEEQGAQAAILLHDIGHGPFSHALEYSIVNNVTHEHLSGLFMDRLNKEFQGKLTTAIEIFNNRYPKHFLYQLVSSQLDMDRLDYLRRDSFFTGVTEGVVGSARIIKMLDVCNGSLVVEAKGIYSIEKFLVARRLMYWQVYLHKTVLAAEEMLVLILKRAKYLAERGEVLFATPALSYFLSNSVGLSQFAQDGARGETVLDMFAQLDDNDIMTSIKVWAGHSDGVLAFLCGCMRDRKLFCIEISRNPFPESYVREIEAKVQSVMGCKADDISYFVVNHFIANNLYQAEDDQINILYNNGDLLDVGEASDMLNVSVLSKTVRKYYMCYPKSILLDT